MKKVKEEVVSREMGEIFKPTLNRVLVELIEEDEKFTDKIYKPKNTLATEPYCNIIAVGNQVESLKAGEIGLMRIGVGADVFKIFDKKYAVLTEFDITAVITQEIIDEMKKNVKGKPSNTLED